MQTEAIVLQTWPYSETSLVVWLLLREHGAVRALAKGARQLKGRTAAALDGFSLIRANIRLPQREGLAMLGSVELRESRDYLHRDLKRLAFASTAMEILGSVASHSPREGFFFREAQTYLRLLESVSSPGSLTAALLLRLLHHAGYAPHFEDSLVPGSLPPEVSYDFGAGVFASPESRGHRSQVMSLPGELVELLTMTDEVPSLDERFVVPARLGPVALRWLIRVWADHLHQEFRSISFLEKTVFSAKA